MNCSILIMSLKTHESNSILKKMRYFKYSSNYVKTLKLRTTSQYDDFDTTMNFNKLRFITSYLKRV